MTNKDLPNELFSDANALDLASILAGADEKIGHQQHVMNTISQGKQRL